MNGNDYSVVGLFTGAGGLDLGFEVAGFAHTKAVDIDPWSVQTLQLNRPDWNVLEADVCDFKLSRSEGVDVLLAGVPCQGFSLGGNRQNTDPRNQLYKQVVRITNVARPRIVVLENVLNLRTMRSPETGRTFVEQIAFELGELGYTVFWDIFKMCHFGVPQTRRRFVFVAFRNAPPDGYCLPQPSGTESIRNWLYDLTNSDSSAKLLNHEPVWGFKSHVHKETGENFDPAEEVVPVRFSRTASDGYPIRSYDEPFPAVDTATVWGFAQGNVNAVRVEKDRVNGKHIRNPGATVKLWRITASRLRSFTHREYARLQTFPDSWEFIGGNKRHVHMQIGNAVPVEFAHRLGENIKAALRSMDEGVEFDEQPLQRTLF